MKKNILFICNIFSDGGSETNLLNILRYFNSEFNFTLASKRYNKNTHFYRYIKENEIKIVTCSVPSPLTMSKIKLFWSILIWPLILGFKKFDKIISLEFSKATPFYKYLFIKKGGIFIWVPLGHPTDILNIALKHKKYLEEIHFTILESEAHKEILSKILPEDKIIVIHNFCFNNFNRHKVAKASASYGKIVIGYLGRYDKDKGILDLLEIFEEIKSEFDNIILKYFGNHGDARDELLQLVKEKKLSNHIEINTGWNTPEEYEVVLNKVDFIVLPSKSEGLPLVLLESMAFGNPFVATNVGAVSSLAKNNPDVIIVDNTKDAIKNGVVLMIDKLKNHKIDRERLRKYYSNNFDTHTTVKKWREIFNYEAVN